jgi:hypothetical protein
MSSTIVRDEQALWTWSRYSSKAALLAVVAGCASLERVASGIRAMCVAKIVQKGFIRCVGGNGIIHRGVSRLEGSCESHVIVAATGVEGP